jgi:hypothetical protein
MASRDQVSPKPLLDREGGHFHFMKNNPMQSRIPGIGVIAIFAQPPPRGKICAPQQAAFADALPEPARIAAAQFALEIGAALVRYHPPCPWQELRAVIRFR